MTRVNETEILAAWRSSRRFSSRATASSRSALSWLAMVPSTLCIDHESLDLTDKRRQLVRHRGREVKTMGDGFLATFDGPARAVRCARTICTAVSGLGVEVRAGLHTGEVELDGSDISGVAVAIGARIGAIAGSGEVLVSSTVKDLVVGSELAFDDRGEHALKGVPNAWHLYAAVGG